MQVLYTHNFESYSFDVLYVLNIALLRIDPKKYMTDSYTSSFTFIPSFKYCQYYISSIHHVIP